MLLGPTGVHAKQHFGPVLSLRATRTGVNFDVAIIGVSFTREEALDFALMNLLRELTQGGYGVFHHALILLHFGKLNEFERVLNVNFELFDAFNLIGKRRALAHQLLCGFSVVPEFWIFYAVIQFREACFGDIPVKDASSAAQSTA